MLLIAFLLFILCVGFADCWNVNFVIILNDKE